MASHSIAYIYVCCACDPQPKLDDAALTLFKLPCARHGSWRHRQMVRNVDGSLELSNPRGAPQHALEAKEPIEIRMLLEKELEARKRQLETAAEVFNETIRDIPSGLPQPDGTQRIRNAARNYSTAREQHQDAFTRLNHYVVDGVVPDDLKS
jgi:hypothetical protein